MTKFKYQNISDTRLQLMGYGSVGASKEITTDRPVENPNFKYLGKVEDEQNDSAEPIIAIQGAQSNAVTEAELITSKEETN